VRQQPVVVDGNGFGERVAVVVDERIYPLAETAA
jgi:hypothetical protein